MGNWLSRIKGTRLSRGSTQEPTYMGAREMARARKYHEPPYGKGYRLDNSGRYSAVCRSKNRTPTYIKYKKLEYLNFVCE